MQFLGTGAADTIPNIFCNCPVCQDARADPDTKTRKRSSFLIDHENLVDFGPDLSCSAQQYGICLSGLRNIFITHTHEDHFCASNFGLITMSCNPVTQPINVYLSQKGFDWVRRVCQMMHNMSGNHLDIVSAMDSQNIRFHPVTPCQAFTVDQMTVLAVETTHRVGEDGETAINYLFTMPDGKKLLYASDTGIYPTQALEALQGSRADYIVMEATFGSRSTDTSSHLNAESFIRMVKSFLDYEVASADSRVYATHINHKHDLTHERYQQFFDEHAPMPVIVARDGMTV